GLPATAVETFITVRATHRTAGVSPLRPVLRPFVPTLLGGVAGILVALAEPASILTGIVAGVVTWALCLVGLWLFCRGDLRDVIRLVRVSVREALPSGPKDAAEEV